MAKRNQFWDFIYVAETTGNKFRFSGNGGESKKDAMRRLYALRANNDRKITILSAQLVDEEK